MDLDNATKNIDLSSLPDRWKVASLDGECIAGPDETLDRVFLMRKEIERLTAEIRRKDEQITRLSEVYDAACFLPIKAKPPITLCKSEVKRLQAAIDNYCAPASDSPTEKDDG